MTVQVSVPLSDSIYHVLQRFASQQRQSIAEAIAQYLELNPPKLVEDVETAQEVSTSKNQLQDQIDLEKQAYLAMYPDLKSEYLGHHIALYQGKLVDHDVDDAALSRRINTRYPDEFVLIRQVESEPDRMLYVRSPRFVEKIP